MGEIVGTNVGVKAGTTVVAVGTTTVGVGVGIGVAGMEHPTSMSTKIKGKDFLMQRIIAPLNGVTPVDGVIIL